jgi:flagellar biosynthesis GTPase FlhF
MAGMVNTTITEPITTPAEATVTAAEQPEAKAADTPTEKMVPESQVEKIINKRYAAWQQAKEREIEEARTEAQKLAKMNSDEREKHEREKREELMKLRESEITRRELRATALETLAEKGMPKELADILPYTNAEATQTAIEATEKVFRAAVEKAVTDRMRGSAPQTNNGPQQGGKTLQEELRDAIYGKKR